MMLPELIVIAIIFLVIIFTVPDMGAWISGIASNFTSPKTLPYENKTLPECPANYTLINSTCQLALVTS